MKKWAPPGYPGSFVNSRPDPLTDPPTSRPTNSDKNLGPEILRDLAGKYPKYVEVKISGDTALLLVAAWEADRRRLEAVQAQIYPRVFASLGEAVAVLQKIQAILAAVEGT